MSDQQYLKTIVRGCYAIQKLRIQTGNRLVANFKAKLGLVANEKEDTLSKEDKNLISGIRADHKTIAGGLLDLSSKKQFKAHGVISSYTEFTLVAQYMALEISEKRHFKTLEDVLEDFPVYIEILKPISGIGPAMAGVIIAEVDIKRAEYPSSLWKLSGLDVAEDGKGRSRKQEHLIDVEYINKAGNPDTRKSITFNPFLKTKLTGVLGPSFIKQGPFRSKYAKAYQDYKYRLEHHADHKEKTKMHRHRMAIRYAVKRFLVDLHIAWRQLEGLPVSQEYSIEKLGMVHKQAA